MPEHPIVQKAIDKLTEAYKPIVEPGTRIVGNGGYIGTIVRQYSGNMYEVRYPGGLACHDITGCKIL